MATSIASSEKQDNKQLYKATISATLGFAIEHYDFILYGTMAALVFGDLFFGSSSWAGLIASFGTFAVGYIARPLGAVVFGHFGDRAGRKKILLVSITLMALSSTLIGLLPTYDQIGVLAPTLLVILRVVQGIALGGESGGSILLTAEHSGTARRGFWSSVPMTGGPIGALLASGVTAAMLTLPDEQFDAWGWRVPFLLSVLLLLLGLYIRSSVEESSTFSEAKEAPKKRTTRTPVIQLLHYPRTLLVAIGVGIGPQAIQALIGTWLVAYGVQVGYDRQFLLFCVAIASAGVIVTLPLFGLISDLVGRKVVMVTASIAIVVTALPTMWMVDSGSPVLLLGATLWGRAVLQAATYAPWPALMTESFETNVRYTGTSVGIQVSTVLAGGFTPMIAASLSAGEGGSTPVAYLMAIAGVISFAAALLIVDRRRTHLADVVM